MPSTATLGFLSLCLIWGLSWVAIKVSLQDVPPFLGVALRCALAALTLGIYARWRKKPLAISRRDLRRVAITGVLIYSGNYGLIHWSEQQLTAGVTALLFSTYPIFVALLNDLLKLSSGRQPGKTYLGLLLCLTGITVIFHDELIAMRTDWKIVLSTGAVLIASFLAASQTLFVKHRLSHLEPVTMAYYQLLLGFWPILLFSLALGELRGFHPGGGSLIALLYLGVFASALAFALFYWLLAQTSAVSVTLFVYITPLVAIAAGWLLLGEVPQPRILVGTGFVLGGILLTPSFRQTPRAAVRP